MRIGPSFCLACLLLLIVTVISCQSPISEVRTVDRVVTKVVERTVEIEVQIETEVTTVVERVVEVPVSVEKEVEVTRIVMLDGEHDVTEVTIWVSDSQASDIRAYEAAAQSYEAAHPEVRVVIEPIDRASLPQRIATARSANRLPDIMQIALEDALLLSAENLLSPILNTTALSLIGPEKFNPAILQQAQFEQQPVAIPFSASLYSLWYRKDIANLTGRAAPQNWNDVTRQSGQLTSRDLTQFGLAIPTNPNDAATARIFEHVALSVGATPFDTLGNPRFDSPEFVAALGWYANLNATALPETLDAAQTRDAFRDAVAVMAIEQTSFMTELILQSGSLAESEGVALADKIGRIDAFAFEDADQRSLGSITTLAITQGADAQSADVVAHLMGDAYADLLAIDLFGKLPVLISAEAAWKNRALTGNTLSNAMLDDLLTSIDGIGAWRMDPTLGADQLSLLADLDRAGLIGQIVFAVADERTLTPVQGAAFLQEQAEALLSLRRSAEP